MQELLIEFAQDEGISEAIETLEEYNWSEAELIAYEKRRDFKTNQEKNLKLSYEQGELKGRQEGYQEGIVEGELKAKQETARKLLAKDLPVIDVMELTGLTLEQIKALFVKS